MRLESKESQEVVLPADTHNNLIAVCVHFVTRTLNGVYLVFKACRKWIVHVLKSTQLWPILLVPLSCVLSRNLIYRNGWLALKAKDKRNIGIWRCVRNQWILWGDQMESLRTLIETRWLMTWNHYEELGSLHYINNQDWSPNFLSQKR